MNSKNQSFASNLLFDQDNLYNIGASSDNRPANIYAATAMYAAGSAVLTEASVGGIAANNALSNLSAVAINTSLLWASDGSSDIGDAAHTKRPNNAYVKSLVEVPLVQGGQSAGSNIVSGVYDPAVGNLELSSTSHSSKGFVQIRDGSGLLIDSNSANGMASYFFNNDDAPSYFALFLDETTNIDGPNLYGTMGGKHTVSNTSLSRASNVVTAVLSANQGGRLKVGDLIFITGSTAVTNDFNGSFVVLTYNGTDTITFSQTGADESATSAGSTYYAGSAGVEFDINASAGSVAEPLLMNKGNNILAWYLSAGDGIVPDGLPSARHFVQADENHMQVGVNGSSIRRSGDAFLWQTMQNGNNTGSNPARVSRLKIDGWGNICIMSPSNANIIWGAVGAEADGAGDIGSPDGGTTMARPNNIWAKSMVKVGDSITISPTTITMPNGSTIDSLASDVRVSSLVVTGDLTVNGTTTTVNSATLNVTDTNITVNNGGTDVASQGAGLTVDRSSTKGSLVFDDNLASKWKLGYLASEIEVADVSSVQTLTNKSMSGAANTFTNLPDSALSESYIKADGSRALTASWNTGNFQILEGAGLVSAPAFAVRSGNLGMFSSAVDTLDFATVGTQALSIDSSQIVHVKGSRARLALDTTNAFISFDTAGQYNYGLVRSGGQMGFFINHSGQSPAHTWDAATYNMLGSNVTMVMGSANANSATAILQAGDGHDVNSGVPLTIRAGDYPATNAFTPGALTIRAGNATASSGAINGADLIIQSGSATGASSTGNAGNLILAGGTSVGGTKGSVIVKFNNLNYLGFSQGRADFGSGVAAGNLNWYFASTASSSVWPLIGLHSQSVLNIQIPYDSGNGGFYIQQGLNGGTAYLSFGPGDDLTRGLMELEFADIIMHPDNLYDIGYDGTQIKRPRNIYVGTSIKLPNGTYSAPALEFSSSNNIGLYAANANEVGVAAYNANSAALAASVKFAARPLTSITGGAIGFANSDSSFPGCYIGNNGSGRMVYWAIGGPQYFYCNNGTLVGQFYADGTDTELDMSANIVFDTDNTYSIGKTNGTLSFVRPANIYLGTSVWSPLYQGYDVTSGAGTPATATTLRGGNQTVSSGTAAGGNLTVQAGSAIGAGSTGNGGSLTLAGGTSVGGSNGDINFQIGGVTIGKFRAGNNGSLELGPTLSSNGSPALTFPSQTPIANGQLIYVNNMIMPASGAGYQYYGTTSFNGAAVGVYGGGLRIDIGGTNTANVGPVAASFNVNTKSSGTNILANQGNAGVIAETYGNGTGDNAGVIGIALDGRVGYGGYFVAEASSSTGKKFVGTYTGASSTGSAANYVGLWAQLITGSFGADPVPSVSAALLADNGGTGVDTAVFQNNGSTFAKFDSNQRLLFTNPSGFTQGYVQFGTATGAPRIGLGNDVNRLALNVGGTSAQIVLSSTNGGDYLQLTDSTGTQVGGALRMDDGTATVPNIKWLTDGAGSIGLSGGNRPANVRATTAFYVGPNADASTPKINNRSGVNNQLELYSPTDGVHDSQITLYVNGLGAFIAYKTLSGSQAIAGFGTNAGFVTDNTNSFGKWTDGTNARPLNMYIGTGVLNLASLTASTMLVSDASKNIISSTVASSSVGYLQDAEALQSFTLADNVAVNTAVTGASWAVASFSSVQIKYSINRNGNFESGVILLVSDGTTVNIDKFESVIGSTGITFDADVSGGNLRLLYQSTSTGFSGTFKWKVDKWLA